MVHRGIKKFQSRGSGVFWQTLNIKQSYSLGPQCAAVFQAELFAITGVPKNHLREAALQRRAVFTLIAKPPSGGKSINQTKNS